MYGGIEHATALRRQGFARSECSGSPSKPAAVAVDGGGLTAVLPVEHSDHSVARGAVTRRARVAGQEPPIDLMNTVWESGRGTDDALATADGALEWIREIVPRLEQRPRSLDHWLSCASPLSVKVTAFDLRRLRDALRRLAADATADERPAGVVSDLPGRQAAVDLLNNTAAHAAASSALVWPGAGVPTIALQGDLPGGIAVRSLVALQAVRFFGGEERNRLRACLAPGCANYYLSGHGRRRWCSQACGNRARVARFNNKQSSNVIG
ncbi:CGNR zinc finger domain-containing protein [Amycolatopsis sp. NPDC023774]|uniref:CGNR zinc finger domain-containing protein n=1 Tax=Amycolatopsis sp. NPDC023774 TaxID=3155015 RepID=UPI0033FFB5D2